MIVETLEMKYGGFEMKTLLQLQQVTMDGFKIVVRLTYVYFPVSSYSWDVNHSVDYGEEFTKYNYSLTPILSFSKKSATSIHIAGFPLPEAQILTL